MRAARLIDDYDGVLLDLDGVVYVGPHAVIGAPETISVLREVGTGVAFVTNNAARTPDQVASALTAIGVPAAPADVVTAAQAAARLLAERVPVGSAVLVVGGAGLRAALEEYGLRPVARADDSPVAVIQGWSPDLAWPLLAEGCVAITRGLPWVASNTDATIPTARGLAPGSGAFVDAIAGATRRRPVVAGKPEPPLLEYAVERVHATRPLFVGDRLDTDIAGATRVHMDSLLVLSGVSQPMDLLRVDATARPTHVSMDLRGLLAPAPVIEMDGHRAWCGGWTASIGPPLAVEGAGDPIDGLRALCCMAWATADLHPVASAELTAALDRIGLAPS
jgi:glycerol-1-phosphatase